MPWDAGKGLSSGRRGRWSRMGVLGIELALDGDPSIQHLMPEGFALGLKTAALLGMVLQEGDFPGPCSHIVVG